MARIRIKCEQWEAWHHCCLCWKATQGLSNPLHACFVYVCPNFISTISKSALYKHRRQPHTHTLNTNHGNPSVAQSFWCWEVDQTKAPERNTTNWWLHNVTACLNDSLNTCNQDTALPQCCELKNALRYMFVKTVLQVVEAKHCHTEVSLIENEPPEWLGSACWNRSH